MAAILAPAVLYPAAMHSRATPHLARARRVLPATLLLVASCGALARPVERPTVSVTAVSIDPVTSLEVHGAVGVNVLNPNGFGLPLSSAHWRLAIGGAHALTGHATLQRTIPAHGAAPVAIDVRAALADALAVAERLAAGDDRYDVAGTLTFSTPLGEIEVRFEGHGRLGRDLPARAAGAPADTPSWPTILALATRAPGATLAGA
jgi:LEA14-like dessication related protein